jgi:2-hydroxy-3-oxopropionate reductase
MRLGRKLRSKSEAEFNAGITIIIISYFPLSFMKSPSVGFIGLGEMGNPMATRILNAKFPLTVYDKDASKASEFNKSQNAFVARSAKELAARSDIILSMLPSDVAVRNAMLEKDGVVEGIKRGSIVIEMSTTGIEILETLKEKFGEKGAEVLDAPVSGIPPEAAVGHLTQMVGGKEEIYKQCLDIFNAISDSVFYVGDLGNGRLMKFANNMLVTLNMMSALEVTMWAKKCNLDLKTFEAVIRKCRGTSPMFETWVPKLISKNNRENPKLWLNKDLDLALHISSTSNSPMMLVSLAKQILQAAKSKDELPSDLVLSFRSLVGLYEELFNTKLVSS